MKVTFLSPPPNLSGGERVLAIYARELASIGHDVSVVCCRQNSISLINKAKSFLKGKVWPRLPSKSGSHYENYGIKFSVVLHENPLSDEDIPDSDFVFATFWTTADWVNNLSSSKGRKFYLIQHDEGAIHVQFGADTSYGLPLRHIYVSQWIADRIRARHPQAQGTIINNAIDVVNFDRGPRSQPNSLTLGMMWAGDTIKGGDLAIEAVRQVRSEGIPFRLIAFGTAEPPEQYRKDIDSFVKEPTATEMAKIYASCTAWLFTSRFEGFGLPILEAMAARTPVIGTATGAAPELISLGGGILVPIDDTSAISDAIRRFSNMSDDDWQTMSDVAYQTASSYTWRDAALEFEEVLISGRHSD